MKLFWPVLYNDETRTLEVLNRTSSEVPLTDNVIAMQREGFKVRCQYLEEEPLSTDIIVRGFTREPGLYDHLLLEYELKTRKGLKKW